MLEFARKYDPQPFHLDDEAAAKTHFGRLAASGWHTGAMTMAVIARKVVDEGQAGLGSPGIDELRWKKPVYPGDTLHVRGKIIDKTRSAAKPDMGTFRTKTTVTNQDGDVGDDLHLDRADPPPAGGELSGPLSIAGAGGALRVRS